MADGVTLAWLVAPTNNVLVLNEPLMLVNTRAVLLPDTTVAVEVAYVVVVVPPMVTDVLAMLLAWDTVSPALNSVLEYGKLTTNVPADWMAYSWALPPMPIEVK